VANSIIIPAFNEEKNVSEVLKAIRILKDLFEILVIDDGSVDKTSDVVRSFGIPVYKLPKNQGKSYAMWVGLNMTNGDNILFLDADLLGIKPEHINALVYPVEQDLADMTIGVFTSGRGVTDLAQKIAPYLSGQRCVKRNVLQKLEQSEWKCGFGIEIALTRLAKENKLRVLEVPLKNVSHTIKEEKLGLAKGTKARLKMYWEIAKEINKNLL
jgi:glycosyltransferase involved in cell wall biosynthesis